MKYSFSKWPGAWERQLIRRHEHAHYFAPLSPPSPLEVAEAQNRDQQELARFHLSLESLITRCTELTEDSNTATITAIKKDLDACHDTAFGLGADLTEQTEAIATLNEVITSAMRRALRDDLARRLDTIIESLANENHKSQAARKLELLTRHLPDVPVTNEEQLPG